MSIEEQANRLIDEMATPKNSLGLLEKQVKKIFCCWGEMQTEIRPFHLIFAADNGVVLESVVKQSPEITYLQAKNMIAGRATISCFCQCNNIPYKVVDVGIRNKNSVGINRKAAYGTRDFLREPAMSAAEFAKAFEAGKEMVRTAKYENYNLLSFGEMGIGNTTTSSAVLYALTDVQPEFIVGYGANKQNPEVIKRKREVVAKGVRLYRGQMQKPEDMIRFVGGFDIAALCGAMLECRQQNMPFVLDGFITAVAFACAVQMDESVAGFGIASHLSREPGMFYALALGEIEVDEVPIRADLALGEGTGAVLFVVMLKTMMNAVWHVAKMSELEDQVGKDIGKAL
jgi:nicotinate-nucleotide--dimethylbenzimidazole phosphoribosyltransferase